MNLMNYAPYSPHILVVKSRTLKHIKQLISRRRYFAVTRILSRTTDYDVTVRHRTCGNNDIVFEPMEHNAIASVMSYGDIRFEDEFRSALVK